MNEDCAKARPAEAGCRAARDAVRAADRRDDPEADRARLCVCRRQWRRDLRRREVRGLRQAVGQEARRPARRRARGSGYGQAQPFDFVLWKTAKPGEPAWDSPWGRGRPGWHIECSAMSVAELGETFDIHGGGLDLKFPHHENEIAQSCGATGKRFVNLWMHNGFVNIDNEKMSKSLGEFLHGARGAREAASSGGDAVLPAVQSLSRTDQLFRRSARAGGRGAESHLYRASRSASGYRGAARRAHEALP